MRRGESLKYGRGRRAVRLLACVAAYSKKEKKRKEERDLIFKGHIGKGGRKKKSRKRT